MKLNLILLFSLINLCQDTMAQNFNSFWYGLPRQPGMMDFTHIIIADNTLLLYHPNFKVEGIKMKIIKIVPPTQNSLGKIYLKGGIQSIDLLAWQLRAEEPLDNTVMEEEKKLVVLFYQDLGQDQIRVDNFNVMDGLMNPFSSLEELEASIDQKISENNLILWWQTFQKEPALQKALQLAELKITDKKGFLAIQQKLLEDLTAKSKNTNFKSGDGANDLLIQIDFSHYLIQNAYRPTNQNLRMIMQMAEKYQNDPEYKKIKQAIDKILRN
jgi:hypothetical protein